MTEIGQLDRTKTILKSLVISLASQCGMSITQLNMDYYTIEGHLIPYGQLGFNSLEHFLRSIPDTIKLVHVNDQLTLVYAVYSDNSKHMYEMVSQQTKRSIPRRSTFTAPHSNTPQLQHKSPPDRRNLPTITIFWPPDQTILPKQSLPSTSGSSLVNNKSDNMDQTILAKQSLPSTSGRSLVKKSDNMDEAIPELSANDPIFLAGTKFDFTKFAKQIKVTVIPTDMECGEIIGIYITEVHSPYKFWFQLQHTINAIDTMMGEMQFVYNKLSKSMLNILPNDVKQNQICAVLFLNLWHRAQILEGKYSDGIVNEGMVRVYFVDYGKVADIQLNSHVKYLLEEFAEMPSQGYRGSLDCIYPIDVWWQRDASITFLANVQNRLVYARVTEINSDKRLVRLIVESEFKQINRLLVELGYAKLDEERMTVIKTQPENARLVMPDQEYHYCDLYPTFSILESGTYPSFGEIGSMLADGHDFEYFQYHKILPGLDVDPYKHPF